jgi:chromosome segregation ATPase
MGILMKKLEEKIDALNRRIEAKRAELESLEKQRQEATITDIIAAERLIGDVEACQRELAVLRQTLNILNNQRSRLQANEAEAEQILAEWKRKIRQGQALIRKIDRYRAAVAQLIEERRKLEKWHEDAGQRLKQLGLDELPSWPVPPVDRTVEAFVKKSLNFW